MAGASVYEAAKDMNDTGRKTGASLSKKTCYLQSWVYSTNLGVFNYSTVAKTEDPFISIHRTATSIWLEPLVTLSETSSSERSRRSQYDPGKVQGMHGFLPYGTTNPSDKTILFQQLLGGCNSRFITSRQPITMSQIAATLCRY